LVLVCPSRPELTDRRPSWGADRRNSSAIALEPLSLVDTSRLTSLLLDVDDLPDSVRARILERAEGNPFFLEEILRQLIDEGRIVRHGARWRAAPSAADVRIPDSVQAVLAARIDLLPAVPKRLLQHAAVVGRIFWTGSLGQQATDDLDGQLDLLEGRDLISTRLGSAFRGERECSFRHVLTRNVAYDSIPRRERARLHAQVAVWLDDVAAGREGEFAELLAHHWTQAHAGAGIGTDDAELERRRQLAHRWCVAAARESHRRAVAERARAFAQRALELAVTPDEVADAAEALGGAHSLMGDGSPAMAAYRIGADALIDAGAPDPDRAAYFCAQVSEFVARWPGSLREPFDATEIRRYLDRGIQLAGDGDSEIRARLLVVRSFWTWGARDGSLGDGATAALRLSDATTAAEMAARLELADVESAALDAMTACLGDDLRYYACNQVSDRRLRLLPRLHDDLERGDTLCIAAWTRFDLGAYAEAFELASQALDETDNRYWSTVLHALAWRSLSGLVLGRWDSVLIDLTRASSILRTGGIAEPPPFASGPWAAASYVRAARGELGEANHLLGLLPTNAGEDGESASGGATVSLALARLGRLDAARRRLRNADRGMVPALTLGCLAQLDVAEMTGDWDSARALILRRLTTPEAPGPPVPNRACADELAAREARAAGDLETARAGFAQASAKWSELGAVWPAARVDLALAHVMRGLHDPGAAERAVSALRVFEAVKSLDEVAEARALLAD
jgi:tetratricopeptide (TPR) repeat protein